jgi:hypothetical protein
MGTAGRDDPSSFLRSISTYTPTQRSADRSRNSFSDGKRIVGDVIVCQEEEHAICCGVMGSRRNRERKRSRKGVRLEFGSHETPGGEAKKAKSEQTDASTGKPKEAGAASAIPLGRWNLREIIFLDGGQLGIGILM